MFLNLMRRDPYLYDAKFNVINYDFFAQKREGS